MKLRSKVGLSVAVVVAAVAPAAPAFAWPVNGYISTTATQTGAVYTVGTGSIRAWQDCESLNGQNNWTNYGPWRGKNVWSWTGTCSVIRDRGFQTRNS